MTEQIHEELIINGQEFSLDDSINIPKLPRIHKLANEEAMVSYPLCFSTACWRQYVGTWKIEDGRLYLIGIIGIYKLIGDEPLFAEWHSGILRVLEDDNVNRAQIGYPSEYEGEFLIYIKKGNVIQPHTNNLESSRDSLMTRVLPTSSGLRYVHVYVCLDLNFPPPPDSPLDIALLRAANRALLRKANGVSDSFLFVFGAAGDRAKETEALKAYGFTDASVMSLDIEPSELAQENDFSEYFEDTGRLVSNWLREEHPAAIAYSGSEYDVTRFWWSGIEHYEDLSECSINSVRFAGELPETHTAKAETWLAILGQATPIIEWAEAAGLGQQRAAVMAATLCEWLHGFEGASGNSYNHFEPESIASALEISEFFLGFEAARLSKIDLDEFCENHERDLEDLGGISLGLITRELRCELRAGLSAFFGGDSGLFWALYSAIWPQFDLPMWEAVEELLGLKTTEFAEIQAPWSFVTDGWCDEADD